MQMKKSLNRWMITGFYHNAVKAELKKRGYSNDVIRKIAGENEKIANRAKDIGKSRLLSSYIMASYFIAVNRCTGKSAEENFDILKSALCASALFHKMIGNADRYLDVKKMPARLKWSRESHERKYENDWVVDILPGNDAYDLGYDYHECGICKLCREEGCPQLAAYLCRMDYVLANLMGMRLVRTGTIAEGAAYCDFRYSRISKNPEVKEIDLDSVTEYRIQRNEIELSMKVPGRYQLMENEDGDCTYVCFDLADTAYLTFCFLLSNQEDGYENALYYVKGELEDDSLEKKQSDTGIKQIYLGERLYYYYICKYKHKGIHFQKILAACDISTDIIYSVETEWFDSEKELTPDVLRSFLDITLTTY